MKIKYVLSLVTILLFVVSCKRNIEELTPQSGTKISNLIAARFENNQQILNSRVKTQQKGVLELQKTSKTASRPAATVLATPYPMIEIGSIVTPLVNGHETIVSDIEPIGFGNRLTAISYRRKNGAFAGGIDIIAFDNNGNMNIVSSVTFNNTDIYSIRKTSSPLGGLRLHFTGSVNITNQPFPTAAVFGYVDLATNGTFNGTMQAVQAPSDIAYDIVIGANSNLYEVYVVTGQSQSNQNSNNGSFLVRYNYDTNTLVQIPVVDARSISFFDASYAYPYIMVYCGDGKIRRFDANNLNAAGSFSSLEDNVPYAKRKITQLSDTKMLVADGRGGIKYLNSNDGSLIDQIHMPNSWPYGNPDSLASFDLSLTSGMGIFAANGTAGLYMFHLNNGGNALELTGSVQFDNGSSAVTAIAAQDNFVVVGTNNGTKIIRVDNFSSIPNANCIGLSMYPGDKDFELWRYGTSAAFAGPLGLQTMHVYGNYTHCGNIAVSKSLTDSANSTITINGNLYQGYTNSTFYTSVEPGATLAVNGNVTIYGDLMLEGTLQMQPNSTLAVYGRIIRSANSRIIGNPELLAGSADTTLGASSNTRIPLASASNLFPAASQGFVVYGAQATNVGEYIEFNAIFPRNMNYMRRYVVRVNGVPHFNFDCSHYYMGATLRYKLPNGTVISRIIPTTNFDPNFTPVPIDF
ncbi:MAG: hypothetical protein ACK4HE_04720 [Chitinophagaceae bacterium]